MIQATLPKREQDAWGSGAFGAPRGSRTHKGIDYLCSPGTVIKAHLVGIVTKLGMPYADSPYRYVEITDPSRHRHRFFYIEPLVSAGDTVIPGSPIGTAQDLTKRYSDKKKGPIPSHVHFEILDTDGNPINPDEWNG